MSKKKRVRSTSCSNATSSPSPSTTLSSWSLWAEGQLQMDHYGCVDAALSSLYKGHRCPVEIISHCVWLYHRFPLSLREVEEMMMMMMMMARGVIVSYESIRGWSRKFGQTYANGLHRRRPRPGDKWHLDEMFIKVHGKTHYLWRELSTRLPPTHEATGTGDEEVHLTRWHPTVPLRLQRDITALPTPPPPTHRTPVPTRDDHQVHHLEPGHRTGPSSRLSRLVRQPARRRLGAASYASAVLRLTPAAS